MTRFVAPQKAPGGPETPSARLTGPAQRYEMKENRRSNRRQSNPGGADGRQEQRSGRAVANHDRRDGEGLQRLRQSGDGIATVQQGRQSGRRDRGGCAEATRRSEERRV